MRYAYLVFCLGALLTACNGDEPAVDEGAPPSTTQAEARAQMASQGLALDIALYPGADVESRMTANGQTIVLFSSSDSTKKIMQHYRAEAEALGLKITIDESDGAVSSIKAKNEKGSVLTVMISDEGDRRLGDLFIAT